MKRMNQRGSMLATVVMIFALFVVLGTTFTYIAHQSFHRTLHNYNKEQAYLSASSVLQEIVNDSSFSSWMDDTSNGASFMAVQDDPDMGSVKITIHKAELEGTITALSTYQDASECVQAILQHKQISNSSYNNFAAISTSSSWLHDLFFNNMNNLDVNGDAFYTVNANYEWSWTNIGSNSTFSHDLYVKVNGCDRNSGAIKIQNMKVGNDLYLICDSTSSRSTLKVNVSNSVIGGKIYLVSGGISIVVQGTNVETVSLDMQDRYKGILQSVQLPDGNEQSITISNSGAVQVQQENANLICNNNSSANVTFYTTDNRTNVYRLKSNKSSLTLSGDWLIEGNGCVVLYVEDNITTLTIDSASYDALIWGISSEDIDRNQVVFSNVRTSTNAPKMVLISNHAIQFDLDNKDYIRSYVYTKTGELTSSNCTQTVFYGSFIGSSIQCVDKRNAESPLLFVPFDSSICPTRIQMLPNETVEERSIWEVLRYE